MVKPALVKQIRHAVFSGSTAPISALFFFSEKTANNIQHFIKVRFQWHMSAIQNMNLCFGQVSFVTRGFCYIKRHRSDSEMSRQKLVHSISWHTAPRDFRG